MTTTNQTRSKNLKATQVGQLISGAKKHFPTGTQPITLGGAAMTIDQVTSELQTFLTNRSAVLAAQATARTQVSTEDNQMPALNESIRAFRAYIKVTFGGQADVLADFGMKPPKATTPMTAEQKAVAVAKRAATRVARGTKGPKAIQSVKGNITAKLVVEPGTTPPPATPPATPPTAPGPQSPANGSSPTHS